MGPGQLNIEQLNTKNPVDADWLGASGNGSVLTISGDNLVITETRFDVDAAARPARWSSASVHVRS